MGATREAARATTLATSSPFAPAIRTPSTLENDLATICYILTVNIVFTPYTFRILFTVYEYDYRVIMLPIPICSTLDLYLSFILIAFLYYFGIASKLWRSVSKLIGIKQCILYTPRIRL